MEIAKPGSVSSEDTPYLTTLTSALAAGAMALDVADRERIGDWTAAQQRRDGGFAGREGESDPYYTAFGLRTLAVLGRVDERVANDAAAFLRGWIDRSSTVVDLISWVFSAAILQAARGHDVVGVEDSFADRMHGFLMTLRCGDGGFAKTPEGHAGSTYQTFLSVLCHQIIGTNVADRDDVDRFLAGQKHPEGGFLEIRAAKRAGVNPTAAAIGTLRCLGRLDASQCGPDLRRETLEFLSDRQTDEGGFSANTRIPFADLLSTFTAMWTVADLVRDDDGSLANTSWFRTSAAEAYARAMFAEGGGFTGFALDDTADVEYTFYGLGVLCLSRLA